jgi:16S rRNA G527 N7-methylase RsmG
MDRSRIAELLHPFLSDADLLTAGDLHYISTYVDILLRWNARMNLTAIRDPEEIITRHFGESFFAAHHLFPKPQCDALHIDEEHGSTLTDHRDRGRAALQGRVTTSEECGALGRRQNAAHGASRGSIDPDDPPGKQPKKITVADIGSGAGFPGIPIKLWAPEIYLTLIESNQKKATFLKEITRALTLTGVDIQIARAELLHSTFDTVTLRAVERFETILPIAANLVSPGGRLALLIGSTQLRNPDIRLPNFDPRTPISVPHSKSRSLQIYQRKS